jgi:hypothetical protein
MKLRRKVAKGSVYETSVLVFLGRPLFWFKEGKEIMAEKSINQSNTQAIVSESETRRAMARSNLARQREIDRLTPLNLSAQIANRRLAESRVIGVSEKRLRQEG